MDSIGSWDALRADLRSLRHASGVRKFMIVLAVVTAYMLYVVHTYGIRDGIWVTLLVWSFFVFGTPIADAGSLLDFPFRAVLGVPMQYTTLLVFVVAGLAVAALYHTQRRLFALTYLTRLMLRIIQHPFSPLGWIVVLSVIGTYLSAYMSDVMYTYFMTKRLVVPTGELSAMAAAFVACWVWYLTILYKYHITFERTRSTAPGP